MHYHVGPKRKALDLPILNVNYEDVFGGKEVSSCNIIEFVEFEWDDKVLDFYVCAVKITPALTWQVREPTYRQSLGRWQKFERNLAPLFETLSSF